MKAVFEQRRYSSKGSILVKAVFQLINSQLAVCIIVRDGRWYVCVRMCVCVCVCVHIHLDIVGDTLA